MIRLIDCIAWLAPWTRPCIVWSTALAATWLQTGGPESSPPVSSIPKNVKWLKRFRIPRVLHGVVVGVLVALLSLQLVLLAGLILAESSVGEATVAIGTLALAIVTGILAAATLALVRTTDDEMEFVRKQTAALERSADTAREELDELRRSEQPQLAVLSVAVSPHDRPMQPPRFGVAAVLSVVNLARTGNAVRCP